MSLNTRRLILLIGIGSVLLLFSTNSFFAWTDSYRAWKTTFYIQGQYYLNATRVYTPGERMPFTFYRETNFVGTIFVDRVLYKVERRNGVEYRRRVENAEFQQIVFGELGKQWFDSATVLPTVLEDGDYFYAFSSTVQIGSYRKGSSSRTPTFRVENKKG